MSKVKNSKAVKDNLKKFHKESEVNKKHALKLVDKILRDIKEETKAPKRTLEEEARRSIYNSNYKDLQGTKIYVVKFVEYIDNKKVTDDPVYFATTPEWAIGFCRANKDMATKFEDDPKRWYYFYVDEVAINDKMGGQGWLLTMDWNGSIINYTYHIDKGYKANYKKEKMILEQQNPCEKCNEKEKDEETKINERTQESLRNIEGLLKNYFTMKDFFYEIKKESDWFKVIMRSKDFKDNYVDQYVYNKLYTEYGVGVGNRILFYFGLPV